MKLSNKRMFDDLKAEAENLSRSGDIILATTNRQMLVICELLQEIIEATKLEIVDDRSPEAIIAEQKIAEAEAANPKPVAQTSAPSMDQLSAMIAKAVAQAVAGLVKQP
jgi:hypothetical protein